MVLWFVFGVMQKLCLEKSSATFLIEDTSPSNLVAWCSVKNNTISIYDLETKQEYAETSLALEMSILCMIV